MFGRCRSPRSGLSASSTPSRRRKGPRPPRWPALTRRSSHAYRPKHLLEPSARCFPDLPVPSADALKARYVELPQELNHSGLITAVEAIVERNDSLIALGPMEPAVIFFRVCLVTGLVLASPWVFYQVWAFIAAGLYRHERSSVYKYLPYSLGLFLAGVFICFFAVLPLTLRFLLEFNVWLGVKPMLRLSEWMGFATILPLVFGLCFQTPLVMMFLSRIGIFTASDYRAKRRPAIVDHRHRGRSSDTRA